MKIPVLTAALLAVCLLAGPFAGTAEAITSSANVIFKSGEGPTSPVDPDEPDKPGPGGPVGGSLAIVSVSVLDFGEITLGLGAKRWPIAIERPNVQTVDLRGVNSGWHLTAQLSQFTDEGNEPSLAGAQITIANGHHNSEYALTPPTSETNIILSAGSDQPSRVITAEPGAGVGLWVMRWYPLAGNDVYIHLEIPLGNAVIGKHSAVVTWTLTDGP